jgi:hypothetical protein
MLELKYCIICEQAIISRETEQLSIINIINGITIPSLPQEMGGVFLVINWQRDPIDSKSKENFRVRISLKRPTDNDDQPGNTHEFEAAIEKDKLNAVTLTLLNIKITEAGMNSVIVEKKVDNIWKIAGTVPLNVSLQA